VPVADPNSRTLNGPSASADDKKSHGGTCEDRAATATEFQPNAGGGSLLTAPPG